MQIKKLFNGIEIIRPIDFDENEVSKISFDNNQKCEMFINLKTNSLDSLENVKKALNLGATYVVTEIELPIDCKQIIVKNIRSAMSLMACNYYDNPSRHMKIIGVTGTNGKTTSTYILKSILEKAGYKVGLIGTNCNIINQKVVPSHLTTPDPFELQNLLMQMLNAKCDYVVMEVSAHALHYHKIDGMFFDVAIFTNLTQDHLDFFETMQNYAQAKFQLFKSNYCKIAIFNVDDEFGHIFARYSNCDRIISYALNNPSDVFAVNVDVNLSGSNFFVNAMDDLAQMHFNIGGKYNVYNVLGCVACCRALGIEMEDIVQGVEELKSVDGRYNCYKSVRGYEVVIDYAHTPDGLENLLKSVCELTKNRVITVFGCGGNRDTTKRPIMGKIAGQLSNISIITSDNPRYEDPNKIIEAIEAGIKLETDNYLKIENRASAIEYATKIAQEGDTIIIAGKGQEDYQDIKGVKHHFSDKEIVTEILKQEYSRQELQLQV